MNGKEKKLEKVLEQVLALQEKGRSREEILALKPEEKNEREEILAVMTELGKAREKILPPRALLEKIVAKTEPVTIGAEQRYNKQRSGQLFLVNKKLNFLNWRIALPAGIIAIMLAVFVLAQILPGENNDALKIAEQSSATFQNERAASSGAGENNTETENIDSVIDSLLADSVSEQAIFAEEDADASLLVADSQEINNFSQSYDKYDKKEF